jgi:glycosyltransferase involved in cell wall biosynthesis
MKVCFLNVNMAGGGAERVSALLLNHMNLEDGYDMHLITDTIAPFAYQVELSENHIHPLYKSEKEKKGNFSFLYMVKNVRRYLKEIKPDVLVCIMPWMTLVGTLAKIGLPVKLIASDHTSIDRPVHFHIKFIKEYIYPIADAVTLLTETDAKILRDKLPKKVVIPNPLAFTPISDYNGNRKNNILAVGRLDVWDIKGFDLLIRAWGLIAKKHAKWKLEIAGTGAESSKQKLLEIAKENGVLDQFELLGFRKDIDIIMRESSIFALTSRIEGFGMALIEAMSQGCACVSFDNGGRQQEIIRNSKEGLIVDKYDIKLLAQQIDYLIINEDARQTIAKGGVLRSEDYSIEIIASIWDRLFNRLVEK